ncbi:hypothetical protein OKA05_07720 [Luteolibacter arcticus]|uniref:Uncharacterized protein n=1 Tax=Luteolibacter arcticus TaxID=1581411 RepID=A0ABT3GG82_9BACT|nr:hypothetical protein [Luteolibacter arcticus]MCW1922438.1 hypothetical protein [Luteolibacter arcticus]
MPAILAGGLFFGWIFARWLERRLDRSRNSSSEELLDELETACTPRRSFEIRVRPDHLKPFLSCVAEQVESGFSVRHARHLLGRILSLRDHMVRHTWYSVKVNGIRTNLDLQWSRDSDGRIRLLVLAVPKIIRELKKQAKVPAPAAPALPQREPVIEGSPVQSPAGG